MASVSQNLQAARQAVVAAAKLHARSPVPMLVAVSKTKPNAMVMECYESGHRHFGENYVQEFVKKAPELPSDIRWHFIGSLQRDKAKKIAAVPNVFLVESVDSAKLATALNDACVNLKRPDKLGILVQVNTSSEDQKGGVAPEACNEMVKHVLSACPALEFKGLMTIGRFDASAHDDCFKCLADCKEALYADAEIADRIPIADDLVMSMGMSGDFATAIKWGSSSVRIGTTIFGSR